MHGSDLSHHYEHYQRRVEATVKSVCKYINIVSLLTYLYVERIELLRRSRVNRLLKVRDEAVEHLNGGMAAFPACKTSVSVSALKANTSKHTLASVPQLHLR